MVLSPLVPQTENTRRGLILLSRLLGAGGPFRRRLGREEALTESVEGVRRFRGRDDGIPDDGLGLGEESGFLVRGGVGGVDVDEELFCVPVEEGGEI